jgi:hypothetical protein
MKFYIYIYIKERRTTKEERGWMKESDQEYKGTKNNGTNTLMHTAKKGRD